MSRKSRRKLLFGLKVLAICGAAVFTVKGIDNLFASAGGSTGKKEDALTAGAYAGRGIKVRG